MTELVRTLGVRIKYFDRNSGLTPCRVRDWTRVHVYDSQTATLGYQTRGQESNTGLS